jgi:hypothetical protein
VAISIRSEHSPLFSQGSLDCNQGSKRNLLLKVPKAGMKNNSHYGELLLS